MIKLLHDAALLYICFNVQKVENAVTNIAFEIIGGKLRTQALEYNVVEHCNLRCNLCDHSSPLNPQHIVPVSEFVRDVTRLATVLHTAEFKLIGGEPLMHPDLLCIIKYLREIKIADTVTVSTNGLLLHAMPEFFWSQIDRLWLSIYPGIRISMDLKDIEIYSRRFGFTFDTFTMNSFRHTTLSKAAGSSEVVHAIFRACELPRINYCHTLRRGIYYKCSPAPFSQERLGRLGISYESGSTDGICIHDNPVLLDELVTYLACQTPLPACTFCLGSSGKTFPHRQMTVQEIQSNDSSHSEPTQLIDWSKLELTS